MLLTSNGIVISPCPKACGQNTENLERIRSMHDSIKSMILSQRSDLSLRGRELPHGKIDGIAKDGDGFYLVYVAPVTFLDMPTDAQILHASLLMHHSAELSSRGNKVGRTEFLTVDLATGLITTDRMDYEESLVPVITISDKTVKHNECYMCQFYSECGA